MFNKPTNRSDAAAGKSSALPPLAAAEAAQAARKGPKVASLVAEDMTIEGDVVGDGEFHVEGMVRGDLKIGRLTISETGQVEGSITAETVECRGRVVGSITAKQVRLYGSAHVDGDITHEQLSMETGAYFQGRSLKFQRPPQPAIAAPTPASALADATPAKPL
jgi:cytoskeletal protein CcmA (bactofilin family)